MDELKTDIFNSYYDARQNKRSTHSQLAFEMMLEQNLLELTEEVRERVYQLSPAITFITEDPVKREIFASPFPGPGDSAPAVQLYLSAA